MSLSCFTPILLQVFASGTTKDSTGNHKILRQADNYLYKRVDTDLKLWYSIYELMTQTIFSFKYCVFWCGNTQLPMLAVPPCISTCRWFIDRLNLSLLSMVFQLLTMMLEISNPYKVFHLLIKKRHRMPQTFFICVLRDRGSKYKL